MQKKTELYSGKAKTLYTTDNDDYLIAYFRNDTSAFNRGKYEQLAGKGEINNRFNEFIMQKLEQAGVKTHFVERLNATDTLVKRLDMIKIECVARNIAAGSLCKRLGFPEGQTFDPPLFEFFYKDDDLGDPLINEEHIRVLDLASEQEIQQLKKLTYQVNKVLKPLFFEKGLLLVDYKLEFGRYQGELLLGDEFTPDGCRLWDAETKEIFDKDRFRQGMGDVVEHYVLVAERLGIDLS